MVTIWGGGVLFFGSSPQDDGVLSVLLPLRVDPGVVREMDDPEVPGELFVGLTSAMSLGVGGLSPKSSSSHAVFGVAPIGLIIGVMWISGGVAENVGDGVWLLHLNRVGSSFLLFFTAGALSGDRDVVRLGGITG